MYRHVCRRIIINFLRMRSWCGYRRSCTRWSKQVLCQMDEFECFRVAFCSPTGASSTHTIYCKTHRVRVNSDLTPNDRTLFTLGWPPYCGISAIKELFSRAGHVTKVFLQANPGAVQNPSRTNALLPQEQPQGFQVKKNTSIL